MKTSIILVAAGKGERFGQPKGQLRLAGKTLINWCLETIRQLPFEKEVIVVGAEGIEGGATRHESVKKGLAQASGEIVLIHNVANPLASVQDFTRVRDVLLREDVACFVGQKNVDTLRKLHPSGSETLDRSDVWRVQTPQGFRTSTLRKLAEANRAMDITDEVQLFEGSGLSVIPIETSPLNQKVTYPQDLELMERLVRSEVLVGIGEDSHFFDTTGTAVLGGLKIEGLPKLHGNSDGDLILHALYNALSSALGGRSLGIIADPMAEQGIIDSSEYLQVVLKEVRQRGYFIHHLSVSIEGLQPKIEPISDRIKQSLADTLTISPRQIGITATSGEGLTAFGKGEGMRCTCVVSLSRS